MIGIRNEDVDTTEKIITLKVLDQDGEIEKMLEHIGDIASSGHSFPVVVDPHEDDTSEEFYIDGDGACRLEIIDVQPAYPEESEEDEDIIED